MTTDGIGHPKKKAFLAAYAKSGIVAMACRAAGVARSMFYVWAEHDDAFAVAAKQAYAEAGDYLEEVALRRATVGDQTTEREIYEGGQLVRREVTRGVSDTMLAMMLNGAKPEKYKARVEHSGAISTVKTVDRAFYEAV